MSFFHGIVIVVSGWVRILTGIDLLPGTNVKEELNGGAYVPAFMENFFATKYRVEVRRIQRRRDQDGVYSAYPITKADYAEEVIRWSTASDQYSVRIKGSTGWLSSFKEIGLNVRNSKKMSKRLAELVRLTSAWFYEPNGKLKVEVIDHSYPECYVDGISAISRQLAIKCVLSNKQATRKWRANQIWKIRTGETACVIFRMLTADGLIKGNALVLPKRMMNGYDVRTFTPNIKSEISTSGWQWVTIEPTYGAIPVKSDDLSHSIYRGVQGLYDDATLMSSLKGMLAEFFQDLKSGKRSEWLNKLAEASNSILHDEDITKRYVAERGLVGRIQMAVAQLDQANIPLDASQTLMFLSVNGLKKQILGNADLRSSDNRVWKDKSRHWFPVPWAYAAHVYTAEVLNLFGFNTRSAHHGFYHKPTHGFVVPGEFFQKNLLNHGGPDLDDTVKVHIRMVKRADGSLRKMAFILRNPNDFGEWSMIPVYEDGPVFHTYGEIPTVDRGELEQKVPQFSKLRNRLNIGTLPCIINKANLSDEFSLTDEERVREAAQSFPAGTGGTVIPKMVWYATIGREIRTLVAPNEDIIDALQQGQAGPEDVKLIQEWIDQVFDNLHKRLDGRIDPFWYQTRFPKQIAEGYEWNPLPESESTWIELHKEREIVTKAALNSMINWLNANLVMPQILQSIRWTEEERTSMVHEVQVMYEKHRQTTVPWVPRFTKMLTDSDNEHGEEYTDRKILRLASAAFMAKGLNPYRNYDMWLYSFTATDEPQPYEWFLRAATRIQDGTYNW